MKRFYIWLCREVPFGREPAKGSVNGIILGLISWFAIILFYIGYLMLGGKRWIF